jgi:hypothetical protein
MMVARMIFFLKVSKTVEEKLEGLGLDGWKMQRMVYVK